jgi:hypothetical protein
VSRRGRLARGPSRAALKIKYTISAFGERVFNGFFIIFNNFFSFTDIGEERRQRAVNALQRVQLLAHAEGDQRGRLVAALLLEVNHLCVGREEG